MTRTESLIVGALAGIAYLVVVDIVAEVRYQRDRSEWRTAFDEWKCDESQPDSLVVVT